MRYGIVLIIGVFLDQITKYWATQALTFGVEKSIVGPLSFQLIYNYGAAYGILSHQRTLLITVAFLVLIGGIYFRKEIGTTVLSRWGMVFIAIGTIGNLVDRVYWGYVIDFINIQIIPIFNVADMAINIGVLLFLMEYILGYSNHEAR